RGPRDLSQGRQRFPIENPGLAIAAGLRKPRLGRPGPRAPRSDVPEPQLGGFGRDGRGRGPAAALEGSFCTEEAMLAQIGLLERLDGTTGIALIDRPLREIDMNLETLARIAHLCVARPAQIARLVPLAPALHGAAQLDVQAAIHGFDRARAVWA